MLAYLNPSRIILSHPKSSSIQAVEIDFSVFSRISAGIYEQLGAFEHDFGVSKALPHDFLHHVLRLMHVGREEELRGGRVRALEAQVGEEVVHAEVARVVLAFNQKPFRHCGQGHKRSLKVMIIYISQYHYISKIAIMACKP